MESDRSEIAKLEEERLMRAFTKKKTNNTSIYTKNTISNTAPTQTTTKKEMKIYNANNTPNTFTDEYMEENISYVTEEKENKKVTKKIIKKIKQKKTSTVDESLNGDEIDWQANQLLIAFYKHDQNWHHAKIKKPTDYGSFWVTFLHENKEQECVRSAMRPIQGQNYQMIDHNKVENEESEGYSYLRDQQQERPVSNSSAPISSEAEEKELSRLGINLNRTSFSSAPQQPSGNNENQDVMDSQDLREKKEQDEFERLIKRVVPLDRVGKKIENDREINKQDSSSYSHHTPSSLNVSSGVINEHQYDVMDSQELRENRKKHEQDEFERLIKRVVPLEQAEKKIEEEKFLKEKQEEQWKKSEERLREHEQNNN